MVNVDEAIIARLKSHGSTFEILVDCKNAIALREGKSVEMADVLATEEVFSDAKKGLRSSEIQLKQVFETDNPLDIAKKIISKGEIQLTAEYRAELRERKKKRILQIIQRNGVDPKTGFPHPMTRIELAIEQTKFHVDEFGSVEKQVQDIVNKLKPILPIKFEIKKIEIKIPSEEASKAYGALSKIGTKIKEEWNSDGSYSLVLEIPAGMQQELFEKLNNATHGNNQTRIIK